jgi:2-oxoisovalerate dehydrogenase E1 component
MHVASFPFNYAPVIESVKKTGRILIAGDACQRGSVMNEMAQNIAVAAFDYLDAPPVVVGSRNWITPAYELEEYFFPQKEWIIDAIHTNIVPLANYEPDNDFSIDEIISRNRRGV